MKNMEDLSFDIAGLRAAYLCGAVTPTAVMEEVIRRTADDPHRVWIHRLPDAALREAASALAGIAWTRRSARSRPNCTPTATSPSSTCPRTAIART